MATPIKIKRSAVSGKRPQLTDLQVGELALNTYDGFLFTERVGSATTVSNLTPWTESYGASSISYLNSVGIGTTNPVAKLDVDGSFHVSGISTFNDVVNVGVGLTGTAIKIFTTGLQVKSRNDNKFAFTAVPGSHTRLFFDNTNRLETTSSGVDVFGT